jgi:hypothetical protein
VNSDSITVVKEGMAGAVVTVVAVLAYVGVCIAVQDGDGHVVDKWSCAAVNLQKRFKL